jgi:SAM-dependent methyltransferase
MLDPDVLAFVTAALPPPPARILEVGAGAGELAEALTRSGHEVVAIDPASETPAVRAVALNDLAEPAGSFDAAVAVLSLHHVEPLAESCRRLGALVRPGGTLVVDELDSDRFDERAAAWWLAHRRDAGHEHAAPADPVADMRRHVHPLRLVLDALEPWFSIEETVAGPYLYRWHLPPGLREAEEALISAGALPMTGARLVGRRR